MRKDLQRETIPKHTCESCLPLNATSATSIIHPKDMLRHTKRKSIKAKNILVIHAKISTRQRMMDWIGIVNSIHQKIRLACDQCEVSYTNKRSLMIHKEHVHQGKTVECDICLKPFPSKMHIHLHKKTSA